MDTKVKEILEELEKLGKEQTKKIYINHGAKEPLFGVTTGSMKPLSKKYKGDYDLAKKLYDTGNYDAMYLAGMFVDPLKMTEDDFEHWIEQAYWHGISDYIVAITLAESPLGQKIADKWMKSDKDLYKSSAYSCYAAMLGNQPNENFSKQRLIEIIEYVEKNIHSETNRTIYSMNNFIIAVGISYEPLHERAIEAAEKIGKVTVYQGKTSCKTPVAIDSINKAVKDGRLGFKRKNVRC